MASWARKFYAKRRDIALGENGGVQAFASIKKGGEPASQQALHPIHA
jgi:hypothetical protein